jgi:L-threonylcarbamoyladenylate synthase
MKTIKININNFKKQEIGLIADFLKKGKVIVCPTDTIYGLDCLATDKKAINKIYRIKKREKKKPLLVLVSDWKMFGKYFFVNAKQKKYLRQVWPGKVSAILSHKGLFPANLSVGFSGTAVRLPKSNFLVKMIKAAGVPLVSTSLNLSQQPHLDNVDNLEKYFKAVKPDLIINSGILKGRPSRLVDLTDADDIKILRK